jgi:5'-nucleotidase
LLRSLHLRAVSPEAKKIGLAAFVSSTAFAAVLGITAPAQSPVERRAVPGAASPESVELQLLGVNDLHGRLEPPKAVPREPGGPPVKLGGAAALAAHLDRAERSHPGRTIRVHAGDMLGASPLLSSQFHDEPTVRAMNLMEFDVGTVGNHEFDEGGDELARLLRGGQRSDGRQFKRDASGREVNTSSPDFEGVEFPYIAANTVDRDGRLRLPPTRVIERAGVKVGFIGVTTTAAPNHVLDEYTKRFDWLDMSDTVNRDAAELRRQGVEAIVVLAHSGAYHANGDSGAAAGEIIDEAREMTGAVDVVIAGHTHSRLDTRVPNMEGVGDKLVVEANSYGAAFDRVRMTVDRRSGNVTAKDADTPTTWNDEVAPDAAVAAMVARYRAALGGLGERVVGRLAEGLERGGSLSDVAARAQRRLAGADVAFVESGNSRGSLSAGRVTYGELFEASAYQHQVMRMEMTGAGVRRVLEQQREADAPLHVAGLDDAAPLEDDATYVVAANALLVDQDQFTAFREYGRDMRPVGTDLEALEGWMRSRD